MIFSVITVTRDNLHGLKRTHESLRAQGFDDYEWIVIDGASEDGTIAYLQESGADFISEPDRGLYDAMNKGMGRARGDYVIFMNAGDTFAAPDAMEKLEKYKGADFIYGDTLENGFRIPARSHENPAFGMFAHHQAMIYRREKIGNLRYDLSYRIAADYKLTLEFLRRAEKISYAPFPVCIFESGGLSQQKTTAGRNEQFRARRELKLCPAGKNASIYAAQVLVMALRRVCPPAYRFLRKRTGGGHPAS